MYNIVLGLHVFVCVLLIVSVLLQSGKGGGLGASFGGGTDNVFGPGAPANIMQKATSVIAAAFLILSLVLALMASNKTSDSILKDYNASPQSSQQQ